MGHGLIVGERCDKPARGGCPAFHPSRIRGERGRLRPFTSLYISGPPAATARLRLPGDDDLWLRFRRRPGPAGGGAQFDKLGGGGVAFLGHRVGLARWDCSLGRCWPERRR